MSQPVYYDGVSVGMVVWGFVAVAVFVIASSVAVCCT